MKSYTSTLFCFAPNTVCVFLPFWKATKSRFVIEPQYDQAYPRFLKRNIINVVSVYNILHFSITIQFVLQVYFSDFETLGSLFQNEFY